jgi:hypothetical protein
MYEYDEKMNRLPMSAQLSMQSPQTVEGYKKPVVEHYNKKDKTILIVVAVILGLFLVGLTVWFISRKSSSNVPSIPSVSSSPEMSFGRRNFGFRFF